MINVLELVTCSGLENGFDPILPAAVSLIVTAIKIIVPIILIIFGMMDLAKAVMSNDEKTMKESQGKFIKRIVYAVIIFFVVAAIQLVFSLLERSKAPDAGNAKSCINCFINNDCGTVNE